MAKKKEEILNLPLREIYIHKYVGNLQTVDIYVLIDYNEKQISVVDAHSAKQPDNRKIESKKFVFACREVEYMKGWHDILDGIKSGVTHAEQKLREYIKADEEREMEFLLELEKAEKN